MDDGFPSAVFGLRTWIGFCQMEHADGKPRALESGSSSNRAIGRERERSLLGPDRPSRVTHDVRNLHFGRIKGDNCRCIKSPSQLPAAERFWESAAAEPMRDISLKSKVTARPITFCCKCLQLCVPRLARGPAFSTT